MMGARENHFDTHGRHRLETCRRALEKNHFEVHFAADCLEAREITLGRILPGIGAKSVSWGDSMTLYATGVLDALKAKSGLQVIETFSETLPREKILARRRQALGVDLFLTGTNAVTETGKLVNLDMIGNRVSAITFGPKYVVLFIGRNKIVSNVADGMARVRNLAAPRNAIRHRHLHTPCQETSCCTDCDSPDRICNTWCITEKSYPRGRIKVVLINSDEGL